MGDREKAQMFKCANSNDWSELRETEKWREQEHEQETEQSERFLCAELSVIDNGLGEPNNIDETEAY